MPRDPVSPSVGGTQDFNLYPYAVNSPAALTDPTALSPVEEIGGAIDARTGMIAMLRHISASYMKLPPIVRPLVVHPASHVARGIRLQPPFRRGRWRRRRPQTKGWRWAFQ